MGTQAIVNQTPPFIAVIRQKKHHTRGNSPAWEEIEHQRGEGSRNNNANANSSNATRNLLNRDAIQIQEALNFVDHLNDRQQVVEQCNALIMADASPTRRTTLM